jgi:hypothetical protein
LLRPEGELLVLVLVAELLDPDVVAVDCVLVEFELDPNAELEPEFEFDEPSPNPPLEEPKPEPKPESDEPSPELEEPRPELEEPKPEGEELEVAELEFELVVLKVRVVEVDVEPVLVPESSAGSQPSPRGWRTGRGTSCVKSCAMRRMVVCTAWKRSWRASSASRFCSA